MYRSDLLLLLLVTQTGGYLHHDAGGGLLQVESMSQQKSNFSSLNQTPSTCCQAVQFSCNVERPECSWACSDFLEDKGDRKFVWQGKYCDGRTLYEGLLGGHGGTVMSLVNVGTWEVASQSDCPIHSNTKVFLEGLSQTWCPEEEQYWYWYNWQSEDTCYSCDCTSVPTTSGSTTSTTITTPIITTTTTSTTTSVPAANEASFEWQNWAVILVGILIMLLFFASCFLHHKRRGRRSNRANTNDPSLNNFQQSLPQTPSTNPPMPIPGQHTSQHSTTGAESTTSPWTFLNLRTIEGGEGTPSAQPEELKAPNMPPPSYAEAVNM